MRDVILTERGPKPIGPYSQAVRTNGFLYVSGQVALDPKTGDDRGGHSPADAAGARKPEGYSGGGRFEPPSRREDYRISEGHERVFGHERSVRQLFHVVPTGALNCASVASSQGCACRDRSDCRVVAGSARRTMPRVTHASKTNPAA